MWYFIAFIILCVAGFLLCLFELRALNRRTHRIYKRSYRRALNNSYDFVVQLRKIGATKKTVEYCHRKCYYNLSPSELQQIGYVKYARLVSDK